MDTFVDNRAQSLEGYVWGVSSVKQEQLQVRCLEETHVVQIRLPLQIVYLGNRCEGYSPSMHLPAKSEITAQGELESHKEYFPQFNTVYQLDTYVGVWWQFRTKMMSKETTSQFVEKAEPLGMLDYSLLSRKAEEINERYPWSLPIMPMALAIGVGFLVTLISAILFTIKLYWLGVTVNKVKGIAKRVMSYPMSCFRSLLLGKKTGGNDEPADEPRLPPGVPTAPSQPVNKEIDLNPVCMSDILKQVLQDERTRVKYGKYLDMHRPERAPRTPLEIQELDPKGPAPTSSSSS